MGGNQGIHLQPPSNPASETDGLRHEVERAKEDHPYLSVTSNHSVEDASHLPQDQGDGDYTPLMDWSLLWHPSGFHQPAQVHLGALCHVPHSGGDQGEARATCCGRSSNQSPRRGPLAIDF